MFILLAVISISVFLNSQWQLSVHNIMMVLIIFYLDEFILNLLKK